MRRAPPVSAIPVDAEAARRVFPALPLRHHPPGWALGLALAGLAAAAVAQPAREAARDREALREAERARAAQLAAQHLAAGHARAAQENERRLAESRVAAAARLHAVEADAADAAARLDALTRRRAEAERRLAERADALAPVLPLARRLQSHPAETLLAAPVPPEAALRGLFVLRALTRRLEQEAAALRAEQAEVQALADAAAAQADRLRRVQAVQAAQADALDRRIAEARRWRDDAEDRAEAAARRAADEAARAETLRAAIERIEAERRQAEAARAREQDARDAAARAEARAERRRREAEAESAERQHVAARAAPSAPSSASSPDSAPGLGPGRAGPVPVAGRVVRAWGERTEAGPANGLSYQAAPAARVVAPCAGRVVFAAPFRSFGPMLILECGGGHHFVLAGLARLDARVGRAVQAGEPVGVMPGWDPGARDGERPTLYVELRRDGRPVNPAPFLRTRG